MADLIQLFEDGLLGQAEDLDIAGVEVVDGDGDGEFDVDGAWAAASFAGFVVTHLQRNLLGGGFGVEAEGLGAVGAGAPALVELKGFVGEEGEADGTAVGELGDLQVAAAGGAAGDGG